MWIMAAFAFLCHGLMNKFGLFDHVAHILMAHQAEVLTGSNEAIGWFGRRIAMAENARGRGNRGVDIFGSLDTLGMAFAGNARFSFINRVMESVKLSVLGKGVDNDRVLCRLCRWSRRVNRLDGGF